jgi:hypothetical protein
VAFLFHAASLGGGLGLRLRGLLHLLADLEYEMALYTRSETYKCKVTPWNVSSHLDFP